MKYVDLNGNKFNSLKEAVDDYCNMRKDNASDGQFCKGCPLLSRRINCIAFTEMYPDQVSLLLDLTEVTDEESVDESPEENLYEEYRVQTCDNKGAWNTVFYTLSIEDAIDTPSYFNVVKRIQKRKVTEWETIE